ncbi:hypothetical protein DE146DRAFT_226995 [Phaeosphaeria sp. MPI-PUGE-AT-0046c]|nr:hypothetical protein DE146DRAFT_226995 [Phaeosphaeria sp. MPI-PUGE-AT-0046c]
MGSISTDPEAWPSVTEELLPTTLFKLAKQFPNRRYAEYFTDAANVADGYRKISFEDFANAVHAMAWWIEGHIGKPEVANGTETMVYCGPNDLRYGVLLLASISVGYKMLFPSPRYGAEAISRLIDQVNGKVMLTHSEPFPVVSEILQKRSMRTFEIPSLETAMFAKSKPYPFTKTFEKHRLEGFLTLHTSGTTGFPKPILWSHGWANSVIEYLQLPREVGNFNTASHFHGKRIMFPFPAFHTSGIYGQVFFPLATGTTVVLPPPAESPSAAMERVADALDFLGDDPDYKIETLAAPPPHTEYLAQNPALLERIARAGTFMFGGSNISTFAGRTVSKKMRVVNDLGSTELGLWPSLERPFSNIWDGEEVKDLWQYTPMHPVLNLRFRPVASSVDGDVGEAVLVRDDKGVVAPVFHIFTQEQEKPLGDLFIRHPRHPELWKHYGRTDELLNFITTEKFHPAAAERQIGAHEAVEDVIMVGTGRPKAALILRLKEGKSVDGVWEVVEEVNKSSPVYARVDRDMLLVVTEPFLLTAKGSIQKKATLDLYKTQLDKMYGGSTP